MGVLLGGWSTRIPELKSALHMNDAVLGRTLIGGSLAALVTSRFIGKLITQLGTRKVFYIGSFVFPIGYLLIAFARNPFFVFLGIFGFVVGYVFLDNPLTIVTQEIEAEQDRKYLSGFHAFWSIGTLAAAFFGSFLIGHIKYSYHLTGIAVVVFFVLTFTGSNLESKKANEKQTNSEKFEWFSPIGKFVILIGFGLMFSNSAEFGATDWSALFLRDIMSITGQLYVGAYLAFESGMIISRLLGDKFIHEYGAAKVIKFSSFIGAATWLITMLAGIRIDEQHKSIAYFIVLIGYFAAGAGVGPLFPGFLTILGNTPGVNMGTALSKAFLVAMLGVAVVPATIGFISDSTNLTIGMLLPISLLFGAGILANASKNKNKLV
jgi:MFS family permease